VAFEKHAEGRKEQAAESDGIRPLVHFPDADGG
jgi:hypothetical protein